MHSKKEKKTFKKKDPHQLDALTDIFFLVASIPAIIMPLSGFFAAAVQIQFRDEYK